MFTKCAVAVGMQDGGRQARVGVRVVTRHEQIERLLQERLWTARVGWRGAAMPVTLLSLAQVPAWWVRVALDGLHHAFSCPRMS